MDSNVYFFVDILFDSGNSIENGLVDKITL